MYSIDIFSKYNWVFSLKDKKFILITELLDTFQKILDESRCKTYKTWVDKGSKMYDKLLKSCSQNNIFEMYSRFIEGKSVVAERLIRILKDKICEYMTLI